MIEVSDKLYFHSSICRAQGEDCRPLEVYDLAAVGLSQEIADAGVLPPIQNLWTRLPTQQPPSNYVYTDIRRYPLLRSILSPDRQIIASSSHIGHVRLWDTETGAVLQTLQCNEERSQPQVFSPDGKFIATAEESPRIVQLWDVHSGTLMHNLPIGDHRCMIGRPAFSPDGQMFALRSILKNILLWSVRTGQLISVLDTRMEFLGDTARDTLAFSPDGSAIVSVTQLRRDPSTPDEFGRELRDVTVKFAVHLWSVKTRTILTTFERRISPGDNWRDPDWEQWEDCVVALSPDNQTLAVGMNHVELWDMKTGALSNVLYKVQHPRQILFSADGNILHTDGGKYGVGPDLGAASQQVWSDPHALVIYDKWVQFRQHKLLRADSPWNQDVLLVIGLTLVRAARDGEALEFFRLNPEAIPSHFNLMPSSTTPMRAII
jgi:hypothetical protein